MSKSSNSVAQKPARLLRLIKASILWRSCAVVRTLTDLFVVHFWVLRFLSCIFQSCIFRSCKFQSCSFQPCSFVLHFPVHMFHSIVPLLSFIFQSCIFSRPADRPTLSARQKCRPRSDSSLWRYKFYADIRRDSQGRGRQTTVGLSRTAIFSVFAGYCYSFRKFRDEASIII